MAETVLYDYWRSSAAYRLRIGLNLLGLEHQAIPVDLLAAEHLAEANLARNPQGLVPTLQIDGASLTQSLAILEYLNETRRAGWLPAGALERAQVRAMAYAVAMDTHPVCNLRVARHAVSFGATMEGWMGHFITLGLQGLEGLLTAQAGPLCHGAQVTLADICLVPQVYNARRWGLGLEAFPRIAAISAALEAIPAFALAYPDRVKPQGPS